MITSSPFSVSSSTPLHRHIKPRVDLVEQTNCTQAYSLQAQDGNQCLLDNIRRQTVHVSKSRSHIRVRAFSYKSLLHESNNPPSPLNQPPRMPPLLPFIRTINLPLDPVNTPTPIQIRPIRALHINILYPNIATHRGARTHQIPNQGLILLARRAGEILNRNVRNRQIGRKLVAQGNVLLAVALRDFNRVVHVGKGHGVVCDVGHGAGAAAALEIA
jgi:hypothetical protein